MSIFEALLYGAIQGLTEYLPVSSSAHLILLPRFLGHQEPGLAFDVFMHLGTFFATVIYFYRDWMKLFFTRNEKRELQLQWIVIATIPALIAGATFHSAIETYLRDSWILAFTLILGGFLLLASDRLVPEKISLSAMTWQRSLAIGVAQCFALVPGMSRSGSTIIGARLLGFDRVSSARFSFLISAPITLAALVFEMRNWAELANSNIGLAPMVTAGFSSFVFGMLAIGGLLRLLRRVGFFSFAVYRLILALIVWNTLT